MLWRWNILLALANKFFMKNAQDQIEIVKRWTQAPKWSWLPKTGVNRKCSKRVQIASEFSRELHWTIFSQCCLKRVRYFARTVDSRRAIEIVQLQTLAWAWAGGLASSLQASRFGISAYVGGRTTAWLQISAKACTFVGLVKNCPPLFVPNYLTKHQSL